MPIRSRSFADRPLLCDLIRHTALNLDRHTSAEAVRRYGLTSLGAIGGVVHRVLPELTQTECTESVSAMTTLAGALWQTANPPEPSPSFTQPIRNWPTPAWILRRG